MAKTFMKYGSTDQTPQYVADSRGHVSEVRRVNFTHYTVNDEDPITPATKALDVLIPASAVNDHSTIHEAMRNRARLEQGDGGSDTSLTRTLALDADEEA